MVKIPVVQERRGLGRGRILINRGEGGKSKSMAFSRKSRLAEMTNRKLRRVPLIDRSYRERDRPAAAVRSRDGWRQAPTLDKILHTRLVCCVVHVSSCERRVARCASGFARRPSLREMSLLYLADTRHAVTGRVTHCTLGQEKKSRL